ncbi:MAG: hemerythrin domain-containing protein [Polyangiaceae bacterium]
MSFSDTYRRQHGEILQMAKSISDAIASNAVPQRAAEITSTLSQMGALVKIHLSTEDKYMYPKLGAHADAKVRDLAHHYQREMGGLSEVFGSYLAKWHVADKLKQHPADFAAETKKVFSAVAQRIQKEDSELYPLVDSIH